MSDSIDKPRWEHFDSRVLIRAPAVMERYIEEADKEQYPQQRQDDVFFEHEGTLVYEFHLRNCMTNIDAYFDPDYLYNVSQEFWDGDDHVIAEFKDVEYEFDVFQDELRDGARVRAWEDNSHEVNVLAEWLYRAVRCDHVSRTDASVFRRALGRSLANHEDPPEWALTMGGTPDGHSSVSDDPITTMEGAERFVLHGGEMPEEDDE